MFHEKNLREGWHSKPWKNCRAYRLHFFPIREKNITYHIYFDDMLSFDTVYLKGKSLEFTKFLNLQRLGGLMSITDKVGLSMSLPLLLILLSSYSGVKTLLPLLVLSEWSVGLKLTGDRKLFPWVLLALGKVLRPSVLKRRKKYATLQKHTPV